MRPNLLLNAVTMITALFFFSSCMDDEVIGVEEACYQILTAEIDGPSDALQSRTCVDVTNLSTNFIGLLWQPSDKIGVFNQDGTTGNYPFTNTSIEDVPQAEFGGEMSGTPYYAYYPYSSDNDGRTVTDLKGTLLAEQPFDPKNKSLVCDYKYGTRVASNTNKFKFKQLFTLLRLAIDASETELQGERLNEIKLTITDTNGNQRPICGDFTFNALSGEWKAGSNTSGVLSMPWTMRPFLTKGHSILGFISVMPVVQKGDKLSIEVITEGNKVSFTADCQVAFEAGYVYDIPLRLKNYAQNSSKYGYVVQAIDRPTITSFGLKVANNTDKLIANKLVWNSSQHTPSFSSVTSHSAIIDNDKQEITLTIPYLYDFKLKPTFAVSSDNCTVWVNGVEQASDMTEVDFTKPVTYTVFSSSGSSRDYIVRITNTGLPVVVINQSASGDFNGVYKDFWQSLAGNARNKFVDFMIRGKDTDWVEDDQITIYNADGTVDCSVSGGVRLRGNTSQDYPKKPFAMKFTEKKSVLGMPKHKRWVLLANWLDHSMLRNTVAFDIAQAIEYAWRQSGGAIEPGIPWNVHGQNVELVFIENGEAHHVGNYLLCEQIKIDENRLNISKPYEDGGNGYLFEIDTNYDETYKFKTANGVPVMFKDDVTDEILSSVQSKIQGIETNINSGNFAAAYEDLDIYSVIDQWLIWELTMNREYGDPRSVYMFMDGNGKLSAGPVWDFDRGTFQYYDGASALGNTTSYRLKPYDQWMCLRTQETDTYSYIWYKKLITDPIFKATVKERWTVIKPYLELVVNQIRFYGQSQAISYEYDSAMWPTGKSDIQKYKSDFKDWSGDEEIADFTQLIETFVASYQKRLNGMDELIGKF